MSTLATIGLATGSAISALFALGYVYSHFIIKNKNTEDRDLNGKNIIVTGGTSGIGREILQILYLKGAVVTFTGRNHKNAREIVAEVRRSLTELVKSTKGRKAQFASERLEDLQGGTWDQKDHHFTSKYLHFRAVDQSKLPQVKAFTDWFNDHFESLDTLYCNAGLLCLTERKTQEGFDFAMGVTHFGHYLMVHELLELLKDTLNSRIVTTSSKRHRGKKDEVEIDLQDFDWKKSHTKYDGFHRYGCSKLANVLFTVGLAHLFARKGWKIKAVSLHPGVVRSGFLREAKGAMKALISIFSLLFWSTREGSQTSLKCILSPWNKLVNGEYYARCQITPMNSRAHREAYWKKFWNVSKQEMKHKGGFECPKFEEFDL